MHRQTNIKFTSDQCRQTDCIFTEASQKSASFYRTVLPRTQSSESGNQTMMNSLWHRSTDKTHGSSWTLKLQTFLWPTLVSNFFFFLNSCANFVNRKLKNTDAKSFYLNVSTVVFSVLGAFLSIS